MPVVDKTLTCRDCGQEFVFTVGEQEFYRSHGLQNEPARCPECRTARRQSSRTGGPTGTREVTRVVCASCGMETEVPFQPRGDRPVYCRECFLKVRRTA